MLPSLTGPVRRALAELGTVERLLLLGVLALHGWGLGWGLPASDGWDVDGVAPRDFLAGLVETFTPGRHFTYPPLHLALLSMLTLPVSVVAALRAPSTSAPDVVRTFIEVPYMTAYALVARTVSLLMSLGLVLVLGKMAARLFPGAPRARAWTFAIAGVEAAGTYYAHTSNLDVPALFWASLALLVTMDAVAADDPRRLRRASVLAACAIATKDQAYAVFALTMPVVLLGWHALRAREGAPRALVVEATRLLAVTVGLVLLFDGALFNPTGFLARLRFLTGPASQDFAQYARDASGRLAALREALLFLPNHYPVIVGPLALAGLALAAARARGRARLVAVVPLLAIVSFTLAFNCVARRVEERFMLPQMQLLAVYAGGAIAAAADLASRARPLAWLARGVGGGAVLAGLHMSLVVLANMAGDARYEAERWLAEHVRPGDVVETYGVNVYLPRFPAAARVERIGSGEAASRNPMAGIVERQAPLSAIEERRPRFVVFSTGYAWRFLRTWPDEAGGHVLPESQRRSLEDVDATSHFHALVEGRTPYRLALRSHYASRWFPPRPLHASLACDVLVFERP